MSILGLLLLTLIPTAFPLSFNMSPITNSDRLNLTGNAYITDEGIQVTTNERDRSLANGTGRATYTEALHLWNNASQKLADFTTHFSFVIDSNGRDNFGDGLAFFLAPQGSSIEPWTFGSGLGLGNFTAGSSLFVAVEFDTYPNPDLDPPSDVNRDPHVGIDLNNLSSVNTTTWHNNVTAGWQNDAYISYDSATKFLSVNFSGTSNNVTRWESLSYEVDLRDYLPEYVIVGFSAATGDYFEKHNVKSWSFSSTDVGSDQEPSPSPEPKLSVLIKSQAQAQAQSLQFIKNQAQQAQAQSFQFIKSQAHQAQAQSLQFIKSQAHQGQAQSLKL